MVTRLIKKEVQDSNKINNNLEKRIRRDIKDDMLGVLIANFEAIDREYITIRFDIDIHGYEKNTYYQNFIQIEPYDLTSEFRFIDDVEISEYGFVVPEWDGLVTTNENSSIEIEINSVNGYERKIEFEILINGEPIDISTLAQQFELEITMRVTGFTYRGKQFWQESLFNMYHLYTIGNLTGAFMNAFIAFEGYIRSLTQDYDTKIADLYSKHFNKSFTAEMWKYRDLRNELMHGNENEAHKIKKADIINVLVYLFKAFYYAKKLKKS
jgi:hypothetical protein